MTHPSHPSSLGLFAFIVATVGVLLGAALLVVIPGAAVRELDGVHAPALVVLALAAGGLVVWTWRGYRVRRRTDRGLAVVAVIFGLLAAGSVDASWRLLSFVGRGTDTGPLRLACGPFGVLAWHWDDDALARVGAAFPGHRVSLDEGCQVVGHHDPDHEVRVTVGPIRAGGVPTRLLVAEKVTFGPRGRVWLSPYPDAAAARADLWRLDGLVSGLGHRARTCKLVLSHGGMGAEARLECSPSTSRAAEAPLEPPCTGDARCLRLDLDMPPSRPRPRTRRPLRLVDLPHGAAP